MSELDETETGLALVYGSGDEARSWIGRRLGPRPCEDEVNWPAIKHFCALVRDRNPLYWNEALARARFGAIPSPPGMLFVWSMPPLWRPSGIDYPPTLATQVPLPGNTIINVSTKSEFLAAILVGDRLSIEETVSDVSPEKRTVLGRGHFVSTDVLYRNQRGEMVARHENVLFRYAVAHDGVASPATRVPEEETQQSSVELLPEVVLPVTLRLCVHDAAATRDYFPGHHDRDYARAQGARDAFLNTMFFHGFVDRVVTDWTGPAATIRERRLRMLAPISVGETIRTRAWAETRRREGADEIVDVRVEVRSERGIGAEAHVRCALAAR
jgi:acyl dehydratase